MRWRMNSRAYERRASRSSARNRPLGCGVSLPPCGIPRARSSRPSACRCHPPASRSAPTTTGPKSCARRATNSRRASATPRPSPELGKLGWHASVVHTGGMSDVDNQRNRGRLSGQVYETLKSRLLDGEYPAGSRVSVETVRSEFGVSKQPVMEALRQLAADGIVEILPQIGCVVKAYSPRDVVDFFEVFAAFEGAMAGAAAKRSTPEDVRRLESIIAEATSRAPSPGADESSAYRRENRDFH